MLIIGNTLEQRVCEGDKTRFEVYKFPPGPICSEDKRIYTVFCFDILLNYPTNCLVSIIMSPFSSAIITAFDEKLPVKRGICLQWTVPYYSKLYFLYRRVRSSDCLFWRRHRGLSQLSRSEFSTDWPWEPAKCQNASPTKMNFIFKPLHSFYVDSQTQADWFSVVIT